MSRFPLHQLLGDPPAIAVPQGRRHTLQDDQPTRNGGRRAVEPFERPKPPKRQSPKPRTPDGSRKLITHHKGRLSTNQRILDELGKGKALTSSELTERLSLPREYIFRATRVLIHHRLVVRSGMRRHYVFMLNYKAKAAA